MRHLEELIKVTCRRKDNEFLKLSISLQLTPWDFIGLHESKFKTAFQTQKMCWGFHLNNITVDMHNEPVPLKVTSPSNEKPNKDLLIFPLWEYSKDNNTSI